MLDYLRVKWKPKLTNIYLKPVEEQKYTRELQEALKKAEATHKAGKYSWIYSFTRR
jgi:hypothetical protein